MSRPQSKFNRFTDWWSIRKVGSIMLAVAVFSGVLGYLNQHSGLYLGELFGQIIADFYANFSTELASIAITVLIIDSLYHRQETKLEKARLIREMASSDHGIALNAVSELDAHGWLRDGSLRGEHLMGANLEGVDLSNADLEGIMLTSANLKGADLSFTNLRHASLSSANLKGANLSFTNLRHANLSSAKLQEVSLGNADLQNASLRNATLTYASLDYANLEGASLFGANLEGAVLREARLKGASLYEANLRGANLGHAQLNPAELLGANLNETDLYGANLQGVAQYEHESSTLGKANTLRGATMPDGGRYNGRFNLDGDIAWAHSPKNAPEQGPKYRIGYEPPGIDINDSTAMANFYGVALEDYQQGQRRKEKIDPSKFSWGNETPWVVAWRKRQH